MAQMVEERRSVESVSSARSSDTYIDSLASAHFTSLHHARQQAAASVMPNNRTTTDNPTDLLCLKRPRQPTSAYQHDAQVIPDVSRAW
jgi:hypothetical protein